MVEYKARFVLFIFGVIPLLGCRVYSAPLSFCEECAPFLPGAVAYWPMTPRTNGLDLSGYENHAKFVGLTYTDGPTGHRKDIGAVHFSGSNNSFAWVTNSPSMQVGTYTGFSFSGFVRFGIHYKSAASLIDWSGDDGNGVYIMATSLQKILVKLHPIHETDYIHIAEFPNLKFNKSSWHFIGVSYDKATGRLTAFIDGKQEVKQLDKNIVAGTVKTKQVGLGIDMSKQSEFSFNGDMSCMMLFKFALTSDEFKRVMEFCRTTQSTQTTLPNITVSDIAATKATASWNKSPGIFRRYKISLERRQIGLGQEFANPKFIPASVTFPITVLTHLVPGATYRVRVWHMERDLVGRARSSAWFDTETSLVVETDSIIFTEITATSANVSWKDVTGDYDGYTVDISPTTGGAKADPSTVPRGTTTTSLKNLSPGSIYIITIRTKIGSATSSPSVQSFQTLDLPKDEPSSLLAGNVIGSFVVGCSLVVIIIVIASIVVYTRTHTRNSKRGTRNEMYSHNDLEGANLPMLKRTIPLPESYGPQDTRIEKPPQMDFILKGPYSPKHMRCETKSLIDIKESYSPGRKYSLNENEAMDMLENVNEGFITCVMVADLKKHYQRECHRTMLLPYRPDRVIDITQFSRNFVIANKHEPKYVTLEYIFNEANSNRKSNRYRLTPFIKKITRHCR